MNAVAVFSGKNLATMREEGGSGHWTASKKRVANAQYLVCIRNRREQWAATDLEHGTAFLIGKVSGTAEAPHKRRCVIQFSEYAEIHVPDAWKKLTEGQRFPVAYSKADDLFTRLGVDPTQLTWQPFRLAIEKDEPDSKDGGSPITVAKEWLAKKLGVDVQSIEVHIRA